jgi:hypothetical protein
MNVITSVRDSDWAKPDGTRVRVHTLRFADGTEAPGYDLPSVPEIGKPLPDGWEVATSKAGKPYVKVPKKPGASGGGAPAYRNTKEGQAFEQQQMNRRTALMQAVTIAIPAAKADEVNVTALADAMYEWLQGTSPVSERPEPARAESSTGDTPVGTGADDEGGSGGSGPGDGEASTSPNPGPSSPDHSTDHVHSWTPSPKLSRYEICSIPDCYETRRKGAA